MSLAVAIPTFFLLSYFFGSIPWGLLIGKLKGIDIRKEGSGNIGATNVTRVLGRAWGRTCFALDFLKGFLPVLAAVILAGKGLVPDDWQAVPLAAVFGTVAGHIWSVWLRFKGGKGVATSAGALMAVAPVPVILSLLVWGGVYYASKYVSLASVCAAVFLPISGFVLPLTGAACVHPVIQAVLVLLGIVTIARHGENIRRLLNGTENRFASKKNGGSDAA